MVVVLGHWLATAPAWGQDTFAMPGYGALNALKYSPLRLISAAPEAVIVFFVLSGFVLALPGRPAYGSFLVRRASRIYPAAWVALAGAALLATATGSSWVTDAPDIVNAASVGPLDVVGLVGHADLLRGSDSLRVDGVVWSLVHELRVSLVFPLLVAATAVLGSRWACTLAVLVSLLALHRTGGHPGLDLTGTAAYLACFVTGISLARERDRLLSLCRRLPRTRRHALWIAAVLLLTSPYTVGARTDAFVSTGLAILLPTAGAAFLIILAQTPGAQRPLRSRAPLFLGRISYSLYLWHFPVLLALSRTAGRHVPTIALAPIGIAIAVLVAAASQRWIEAPLIRRGARVAARRTRSGSSQPRRWAVISQERASRATPRSSL